MQDNDDELIKALRQDALFRQAAALLLKELHAPTDTKPPQLQKTMPVDEENDGLDSEFVQPPTAILQSFDVHKHRLDLKSLAPFPRQIAVRIGNNGFCSSSQCNTDIQNRRLSRDLKHHRILQPRTSQGGSSLKWEPNSCQRSQLQQNKLQIHI
jgi:hypothetical protein